MNKGCAKGDFEGKSDRVAERVRYPLMRWHNLMTYVIDSTRLAFYPNGAS